MPITDLEIEYLNPSNMKAYTKNSRTHSRRQVRQVVQGIHEFGFTNPVLVDGESTFFAGHGRVIAHPIKDCSERGDIVLNIFGESGSLLIAAEKADWQARVCELNSDYCDRIIRRWQIFALDEAICLGSDTSASQSFQEAGQ